MLFLMHSFFGALCAYTMFDRSHLLYESLRILCVFCVTLCVQGQKLGMDPKVLAGVLNTSTGR